MPQCCLQRWPLSEGKNEELYVERKVVFLMQVYFNNSVLFTDHCRDSLSPYRLLVALPSQTHLTEHCAYC